MSLEVDINTNLTAIPIYMRRIALLEQNLESPPQPITFDKANFESPIQPISSSNSLLSLINATFPPGYELPIEDEGYSTPTLVLVVILLMVIIVGTIVGNTLVCVAVCLVRKLRRPYNYLLVSLAVSDMCVAILVMPMALLHELSGEWQFGKIACNVWVSFDVLSCTASILNLCMISVDRYLAITRPLEYGVKRTPKRMFAYILFVWLGAAFISVPPILILGNEHGDGLYCQVCQNFWYQIYATFGSFYIPLTVMVTVYYKIFQAAKRIVTEEKKAQKHMKLVEEQSKKSYVVAVVHKNNSTSSPKTQQNVALNHQLSASRHSVAQINKGEVEIKLGPAFSQRSPSWSKLSPSHQDSEKNEEIFPNNFQNSSNEEPCLTRIESPKTLEVPPKRCLPGSLSSTNTATTCESSASSAFDYRDLTAVGNESWHSNISQVSNENKINTVENNQTIPNSNSITIVDFVDSKNRKGNLIPTEEMRVSYLIPDLRKKMLESAECENECDDFNTIGAKGTQALLPKTVNQVCISAKAAVVSRNNSDATYQKKKFDHPKSRLKMTLAKERKASTTLGIIMSSFILCWLPFFVLALIRPFLSENTIPASISSLFLWLGYANSLLNPIIYATLNKDFRKPFREILCLRCGSLNLLMREEFYYSQYGPDSPLNHSHNRQANNDNCFTQEYSDEKLRNRPRDLINESRF